MSNKIEFGSCSLDEIDDDARYKPRGNQNQVLTASDSWISRSETMTNEQIISLARDVGRTELCDTLNEVGRQYAMPLMIAYNLLRGHKGQVGIPDGPDHDQQLDRCKAIAKMLGAYHAKLRIEHPQGPQYLDAFIPLDRPDIRQRIQDSLALIGGKICDFH